jgi:hypothetical protein
MSYLSNYNYSHILKPVDMKNIRSILSRLTVFSFLVLFSLIGIAQDWQVNWENPISVSTDEFDNNRPKLSINASNEPVIIWGKDNGRILYTSKLSGDTFSPPEALLDDDFDIFTADWAGPEIGSNGDHVHVVFKRYPENEFGVYSVISTDGGITWSDTVRVDNVPIGDEQTRFPYVVVDEDGNPAVSMMTFVGNYLDPAYEVTTSTDGGNSYNELMNASTELFEGEACDCCTGKLVFDGSRLIQLYRNNDENIREIRATVSEDWGQSFSQGLIVDGSETFSNVCFSSGPSGAIIMDDLLSVFRVNTDLGPRVGMSSFNLENQIMDVEDHIAPNAQPSVGQTNPAIASGDGFVGVIWQEETTNDDNIHFVFSSNGAQGILDGTIEVLNFSLPGKQINPDIKYQDGVFHVVWQDKATGLVMYRKGSVLEATGVEEMDVVFSVFPNPTSSSVQVAFDGRVAAYYTVSDLAGKVILRRANTASTINIDLTQYPSGTYILELYEEDGSRLGQSQRIQRH